jgi:N-acetyl-gamma-glutamyl-phosphate reductase
VSRIRAAVVGATGYTGAELVRLLLGHPSAEVVALTSRDPGAAYPDLYPHMSGLCEARLEPFDADAIAARADVAFVGLPHHAAMEAVVPLAKRGLRVIDLSADFRLRNVETYRRYYGEHLAPELLPTAVYGLPELFREEIRRARIVAVPGCYPTSVILPLAPLLARGLIAPRGIIADCKSGVSGAGRAATADTHYPEVEGGLRPYKVGTHRHQPEMEEMLERATHREVRIVFTPHLVPMKRGILATVYADALPGTDLDAVRRALAEDYGSERFVRMLPDGRWPDTAQVNGSNYVHLAASFDAERGKVLLLSALDNLVKGASGAAVQSMNLLFGLPEAEGLGAAPLFP